jgi:sec-independent protein translocase protein TatA
MLGNIGPLEIIVVLIIALVVFGPKRLPELGSSLGRGIREFKETVTGDRDDDKDDDVKALSGTQAPVTAPEPPEAPVATAPLDSADVEAEAAPDKNS